MKLGPPSFMRLIIAVTVTASAAQAADVGLLGSVVGDVQIARIPSGKLNKASVMQSLPEGSRVKVGPNSRAIAILFQGSRYELAPGSVTSFSSGTCSTVSGPAPKSLAPLLIRQAKLLAGSRVASGRAASTILRGGSAHIELQSLSATSIREARPVFQWGFVPGAVSYKVRLWNTEDELVWQGESQSPRLAYPADGVPLTPAVDYLWSVSTVVDDTLYKGEGIFRIFNAEESRATKDELDALDSSDDEAVTGVIRAEIFARHELWDDAIATYQGLEAKYPDSVAIRDALNQLLSGQARGGNDRLPKNGAPKAGITSGASSIASEPVR